MRILLLGKDGQLGQALAERLGAAGDVTAMGRDQADFSDTEMLRAVVQAQQPQLIVNAAAYTAVDKAESEPELAMRVNTTSVGALGEEAAKIGARVLHYSTDYVFNGAKATPYVETDATGPLNIYGESKLAGENALLGSGAQALVLRTSWVYAARGRNFLHTMLRLGAERPQLRVVDDQIGAPTAAEDLADATVKLLAAWKPQPGVAGSGVSGPGVYPSGVYHATAGGAVSWAGFARQIFALAGLKTEVVSIATEEYPTPAVRPRNSRLACEKLSADFSVTLPDWKAGLQRVMAITGRG